jgi:hypothetical protein
MREGEFKRQLNALGGRLPHDRQIPRRVFEILAEIDTADGVIFIDIVRELLWLLETADLGIAFDDVDPARAVDAWLPLDAVVVDERSPHRCWIVDIAAIRVGESPRLKTEWEVRTDFEPGPAFSSSSDLGGRLGSTRTPQLSLHSLNFYRDHGASSTQPGIDVNGVGIADEVKNPDNNDETIRRTPHIDPGVYATAPVPVGARFLVRVYLDTSALEPGEEGNTVELPHQDDLRLTVNLAVSSHFTVDGLPIGQLNVNPDTPRSSEATFSVTCQRADPSAAGIAAILFHEWRPVGSVSRQLTVAGGQPPAPLSLLGTVQAPPPPAMEGQVVIHSGATVSADLTITISRAPDGDERHYSVTVRSPHLPALADGLVMPWNLPSATRDMVEGMMSNFLTRDRGGRLAALRGAGIKLFSATPNDLQNAFWKLIDHTDANNIDFETIYVVTDEPYIPWELMIPTRAGGDPRPALGVEFAVGRWVQPTLVSPQQMAPITDSWVIAPDYLAPDNLKFAAREAQFIIDNFHGERLTPAYIMNIDQQLGVRGASLLHFICHGVSEPTTQILKLDPDEQLTDLQVRGLNGVARAFKADHPFVFINACQVGQVVPALAGSTGFAAVFTEMGARGVVAPIWSVRDSIAAEVAREFYTRIKGDPTLPYAKVLRDVRKLAYEGEDPEDSYAAYCFYGDPNSAQQPLRPVVTNVMA